MAWAAVGEWVTGELKEIARKPDILEAYVPPSLMIFTYLQNFPSI